MPIRLDQCVSAAARDAGLDPDRATQDKTNIVGWINDIRLEIRETPAMFNALKFSGEIVGVANVTAGTVTVTQNKSEVTGASTSFATAMAGRWMEIGSQPWQRISYVSDSTHLTLDSGWPGASLSSQSYRIWKRDYGLPPKVGKVLEIIDPSNSGRPLAYYDPFEFRDRFQMGDSFGDPRAYTQFGQGDYGASFLGSTIFTSVTSTANSPVLDFSGTGLVTAMSAGDRINLGDSTTSTAFTVDRILTDTKVVLNQHVGISNAALSATAFSLDRIIVRFYTAIDNTKVYPFEAVARWYNLIHNGDYIEEGWYSAILKGAVAKALKYVSHPRADRAEQEYRDEMAKLIRNQYKAENPANRLKPYIDVRYSARGVVPSDKDVY